MKDVFLRHHLLPIYDNYFRKSSILRVSVGLILRNTTDRLKERVKLNFILPSDNFTISE